MKIEVRPINSKKWHKKIGKESFARPVKIQALVDADSMAYATGLTSEDIKLLETKHNMTYDLSDNYSIDTPHPFWDSPTAVIKLDNKTTFFDDKKPLDFIKIHLMKVSPYVANSLKEFEEGMFPEATHIIFDEKEEVEAKASKIQTTQAAVIKSAKLTKERKAQIIMILSGKDVKGQSDDFVDVEMYELIQVKAFDVLEHLNMDEKDIALHALVLEALHKNVLTRKGHKIVYGDGAIGMGVAEAMEYLKDDENQSIKLSIMNSLEK